MIYDLLLYFIIKTFSYYNVSQNASILLFDPTGNPDLFTCQVIITHELRSQFLFCILKVSINYINVYIIVKPIHIPDCPSNKWGPSCVHDCKKCVHGSCDAGTGECRCQDGWQGERWVATSVNMQDNVYFTVDF